MVAKIETTELEKQIRNVNTATYNQVAYDVKRRILKIVRTWIQENYPFIK